MFTKMTLPVQCYQFIVYGHVSPSREFLGLFKLVSSLFKVGLTVQCLKKERHTILTFFSKNESHKYKLTGCSSTTTCSMYTKKEQVSE